jgi:hypothetical protein
MISYSKQELGFCISKAETTWLPGHIWEDTIKIDPEKYGI